MGGTFDPIHNGHLVCAEEARYQFELDEVLFVPAGNPWQKSGVSSAEDRYLLTVMATASNEHFSVSRIEIDRSGPTYTRDTLRILGDFYAGTARLFFITGADAVAEILSWKDPQSVLEQAHFIAASRPAYELGPNLLESFGDRVSVMKIPALAISSTDIRQRVLSGRPVRYLVPREVDQYIATHGMYLDTVSGGL